MRVWIGRRHWWVLAALVVIIYGFTGGCYAQRLPPSLGAVDAAAIAGPPLPFSVVVVPWDSVERATTPQNPVAYQELAYRYLKGTHAFRSVRMGSSATDSADLVATSTHDYCNSAAIPVWTGLSLGFYPTIFTDSSCDGVVIRRLHAPHGTDSVVIQSALESRSVMGWAAVIMGALPGWTHGEARRHHRAGDRARMEAVRQRTALAALASRR